MPSEGNWGLYLSSLEGTYSTAPTESWAAKIGGKKPGLPGSAPTYFLGDIQGYAWGTDTFEAGIDHVTFLNDQYEGYFEGDLLAAYDNNGNWKGVSLGTVEMMPLAYSGRVTNGSFYWQDLGISEDGSITGLMGGTDPLLTGAPGFVAMGEYSGGSDISLFKAEIDGTYDGSGSFLGFMSGVRSGEDIGNSKVAGVYFDGTAMGYLNGDFTGTYHPDIAMWEVPAGAGALTASLDLNGDLAFARIDGAVGAQINEIGGDIISLDGNPGWGLWLGGMQGSYQNTPGADWSAKIGGKKIGLPDSSPTYFLGDIAGSAWESDRFEATISNVDFLNDRYFGHYEGDLLAAYDNNGNWKGVSSGLVQMTPLTHSSQTTGNIFSLAPGTIHEADYKNELDGYLYTYEYIDTGIKGFGASIHAGDSFLEGRRYSPDNTYVRGTIYPVPDTVGNITPWDIADINLLAQVPADQAPGENYVKVFEDSRTSSSLEQSGSFDLLMGGSDSLWSGDADVTLFADYDFTGSDQPGLFATELHSFNTTNATMTTFDNGAYGGFFGASYNGVDKLSGEIYAIYIDPNESDQTAGAGILKGHIDSLGVYPDLGISQVDGTLSTTQLGSDLTLDDSTSLNAFNLHDNLNQSFHYRTLY